MTRYLIVGKGPAHTSTVREADSDPDAAAWAHEQGWITWDPDQMDYAVVLDHDPDEPTATAVVEMPDLSPWARL